MRFGVPSVIRAWPLGLVLAVAVLDQATKGLARTHLAAGSPIKLTSFLDLNLGSNPGVVFGVFSGARWGPWPLIVLTAVIAAGLSYWLIKEIRPLARGGLALMVGGAIGNLWDRLMFGAVTDFLDLHVGRHHWPAFNVADAVLMVGVALVLFDRTRTPGHAV